MAQLSSQERVCSFGSDVGPLHFGDGGHGDDGDDGDDYGDGHFFSCGAHDTADTPVKKAKSARHCFS